jgi:hypothetical protein
MVVWGGGDNGTSFSSGGRLAVSDSPDLDGDAYTVCAGDCDDADPTVYPGAPQLCDGINNDCSDPSWPAVPPTEVDADHDGRRICAGDCNDTDALAWHLPAEVTSLALDESNPTHVTWDSQSALSGPETTYDLVSGSFSTTPGISFDSRVCLQSGEVSTNTSDLRAGPLPGMGFWYLSRAGNSCGTGTYGTASSGAQRTIPSCP